MQYFKSPVEQDRSSGPPDKWRQFKPALAIGLATLIGLPATSFAGSISGYKFLDIFDTGNGVIANGVRDDQDTLLENHMILLKQDGWKLTEQLTDDNGYYSFPSLSDGKYQLSINIPRDTCSTAPKVDKNIDHSRNIDYDITIKDGQNREIDIGISTSCVDPITPDEACDIPSVTSQKSGKWNDSSIWSTGRIPSGGDKVKVSSGHAVTMPPEMVNLGTGSLCNEGVIASDENTRQFGTSDIEIHASTINNRGKIIGQDGVDGSCFVRGVSASNIMLFASNIFVNETTDSSNEALILTGNGGTSYGGNSWRWGGFWGIPIRWIPTDVCPDGRHVYAGDGGGIEIKAGIIENYSNIVAGNGGNAGISHHAAAVAGEGGYIVVSSDNVNDSVNFGSITTGTGGWSRGYRTGTRHSKGGNVIVNLGDFNGEIVGAPGSSMWGDPINLNLGENLKIRDFESVNLYTDEGGTINFTKANENTFSNIKVISIATKSLNGEGGIIDLRGISGKIFKANEKVEIFADNILLDDGVDIRDLIDAPEIVIGQGKVIYHVQLSSDQLIVDEPSSTVTIPIKVFNASPKDDSYTFTITDSNGWTLGTIAEVAIKGLKSTNVNLNVTLPNERAATNEITITATSKTKADVTSETITHVMVDAGEDSDGDGHPDVLDQFPDDADEWLDTDGDGKGDNVDTDDDGDGMSDEFENQYFEVLDFVVDDAKLDADGDGFSNLLESQANTDPTDPESIPPSDYINSIVIQDNENTIIITPNGTDEPETELLESSTTPDLAEGKDQVTTGSNLVGNDGGSTVVNITTEADGSIVFSDPNDAGNVLTAHEDDTLTINDPDAPTLQVTFDNEDNMQAVDTTEPNIVLTSDSEGNVSVVDITLPDFIATLNEDASITGVDADSGMIISQDQQGQQIITHPDFPGMQATLNDDNTLSVTDIETPEIIGVFNPQDDSYQIINAIDGTCYDESASNLRGWWKKVTNKVKSFVGKAAKFVNKVSSKVTKVASFVSKAAGIVHKVSSFFTTKATRILGWSNKVLNWACRNCHPIIARVASRFVSTFTSGSRFLTLANRVSSWSSRVRTIADRVTRVSSKISSWSSKIMRWSGVRRAIRSIRDGRSVITSTCTEWDIVPNGDYKTIGTIRDELGSPIADVVLQIGDQTITTDAAGNWEIGNLVESEYTAIATKDDLTFMPVDFEVGNGQLLTKIKLEPLTKLKARIATKIRGQKAEQGKHITYVITVVNGGDKMATGGIVTYQIPTGTELVDIQGMGEVICDGTSCAIPDLPIGGSANIEVVLSIGQISNTLVNQVTLTSNEFSTDVAKTWTRAKPYLSVFGTATPKPVTIGGTLHYSFDVELNDNALEGESIGTKLKITLPKELSFESAPANCNTDNLPEIICPVDNLSVENPDDTSMVTINIDTIVEEPGLIKLIAKAQVSSDNYIAHTSKVRTEVNTQGIEVDGVIVMDVTNSMGDQINGIIRQVKQRLIDGFANGATPLIAVVTFRDEDDIKLVAITNKLETLLTAVESLQAKDGGMCPEASADALLLGLSHLKQKGTLIFVTDAPPYSDAETQATLNQITQLLDDKEINRIPIMAEVNCDGGNVE
ncbi:SdrD B-like domain-containing protein [Candidatus Halobeggiatoa sp. HSG11]|nr:SdrD B-like domain-containing protein [Candidatus Halobeggiatoa sp. HSG11]